MLRQHLSQHQANPNIHFHQAPNSDQNVFDASPALQQHWEKPRVLTVAQCFLDVEPPSPMLAQR